MHNNDNSQSPIKIIPILKESLIFYKDHFNDLVSIIFIGYALSMLQQVFITFNISLLVFSIITLVGGFVLTSWGCVALILAAFKKYNNESMGIKQAFVETKGKILRYIGISFLFVLILAVGFLLLVIPGLYWGTVFALVAIVLVLEDTSFWGSFQRSKDLVHRHFWPIFGLYLLLFVMTFPINFLYVSPMSVVTRGWIMYLMMIILVPWGIIVNVIIYQKLKNAEGMIEISDYKIAKRGGGCLGCLAMIGLCIIMTVLSSLWIANVGKFIKTEKGKIIYTWVVERISPEVKFEDGVTLEHPPEYFVIPSQEEDTTFALHDFSAQESFRISTYSISYAKLGITNPASVKLEDDDLWEKYYAYLMKSEYNKMRFSPMAKVSSKVAFIDGRPWGECVYKYQGETRDIMTSWAYYYTLSDSVVIFVNYVYGEESKEERGDEVKRILAGFRF